MPGRANSWLNAAGMLGLDLVLACPAGFEPNPDILAAAAQADVVSTDVWASMGQEEQVEARRRAFSGFCVDEELLGVAAPDVIVLHCLHLPVWRQAENRLYVQKAIPESFLSAAPTAA